MAITTYTYFIDSDFLNHWVDLDRFKIELNESDIETPLNGIYTSGDEFNVSFKNELSSEEEDLLNILVASHSGEPIPVEPVVLNTISNDTKNSNGTPVVSPTHLTINEAWRMEGIRFTASGNTTTMYDFKITKEVLMQGGSWWVQTTGNTDSADFSIVDKDNILGLHTLYGLPVGAAIELKKFVKNYFIPPGTNNGQIQSPTVSPVVSGLYIRTTYDNNGDDPAQIGVNYIWYEKA